jgi:hypothetical protein
MVKKAINPISRNKFARVFRIAILLMVGWTRKSPRLGLQAFRAQDILGHARQPIYEQG